MNGKSIDYAYYDEIDRWPHYFKKKNNKKWCKGKVGRQHEPVIELNRKYTYGKVRECTPGKWWGCYHHEVCKNCHKELRWRVPCPDLVDRASPVV